MFINEYGDREDTTVILLAPMMVSGLNLYELIYVNEIERFIESGDIEDMKKTAAFRAADRNPYSWNMEFIPLASKKKAPVLAGVRAEMFVISALCVTTWTSVMVGNEAIVYEHGAGACAQTQAPCQGSIL